LDLEKAMIEKKPYADYIVTQWLLDAKSITTFISKQTLPVHVGITGPLKISSLLNLQILLEQKIQLIF
jgi:methylenetetrahydrofolate reductase (NADPH)